MGRLVLDRLVLVNFKSYAGTQVIGPFGPNFTAVVGPNGSGKSNVIDSLLFVFGWRAKKLRHGKLTNLIHSSEAYPDLDFARVELHFRFEQDGNAGEQLPEEEMQPMVVAREVHRERGSSYVLNGKTSSYQEVRTLLKRWGIDLDHKRFLILQGEVESIALMKPRAEGDNDDGLLEYLEDIIGTSQYKQMIEQLEGQVDELKVDAADKEQRAQVLAKDVARLDAERAEIEAFMHAHNQAAHARSTLWQFQRAATLRETAVRRTEAAELEERNAELESETADKRRQIGELETEVAAAAAAASKLRSEHAAAVKAHHQAQLAAVKAAKRIEQATQRRAKLERDVRELSQARRLEQTWIEQNAANVGKDSRLVEIRDQLAQEQSKLDAIQARLAENTKELTVEMDALQTQAEPARARIRDAEQAKSQCQQEVARAEREVAAAKQREDACTASAQGIADRGIESKRETKRLEKELAKIDEETTETAQKLADAERAYAAAEADVAQHRPAVQAAHEARDAAQTRDRKETQMLQLREKFDIRGLYGRLGSLGSIDPKYDVAVSTAGRELNNYVVDSVATAQKCVALLRQERIGTAKFMILDLLKPPKTGGSWPAPRLYDLVQISDPRFASAFYAVLGDCLVTTDLSEARRVAFDSPQRHKVVTLDGMLVNPSGAMAGGGTPPRGLLSKVPVTVTPVELDELEKKLNGAKLAMQEERSRVEHWRSHQAELASKRPVVATELSKAQLSLRDLENQMREQKTHRTEAKQEHAKLLADLEAIRVRADVEAKTADAAIAAAELDARPLERQIEELQARISEIGGLELRMQLSKVDDLTELLADFEKRANEQREELTRRESRVRQLDGEIELLEQELTKVQALADNSNASAEEEAAQAADQRVQQLSGEIVVAEARVDDAKTAVSAIKSEIDAQREAGVEVRSRLESLRESLRESEHRIRKLEAGLAELSLFDVSLCARLPSPSNTPLPSTQTTPAPEGTPAPESAEQDEDESAMVADPIEPPATETATEAATEATQLAELTPDELEDLQLDDLTQNLKRCERKLADTRARADDEVLRRYRERHAEWLERQILANGAVAAFERVKRDAAALKQRRLDEFLAGFNTISAKLKEMYSLLTMGGNAELELVDSLDPFAEGILFSVMPPRKSWRNIGNLSGGEKTLSSLALVFALHHYKPTPLYVMDEIDAALDFRNVSIIANYIKDRTKNGQFIVISLRNNMFELASRLVGIYKTSNKSGSVTYNVPTAS